MEQRVFQNTAREYGKILKYTSYYFTKEILEYTNDQFFTDHLFRYILKITLCNHYNFSNQFKIIFFSQRFSCITSCFIYKEYPEIIE